MIPHDTVQAIIDASRIEDVISDFVSLKRRGTNMVGSCPFHNERTPSFYVSPSKGIYKCFGCGKAGNSVNFVMEHEKFTYPEALRYLAKKYHIDIKEEEETAEQLAEKSVREALFIVNEFARKYFSEQLFHSDEGRSVGLSYFRNRGMSDDIIRKFQLGYCPTGWENFTKEAITNGFSAEILEKAGLSKNRDGHLYDAYRERVIFPIHSQSNRVIGFGGRIMTADKNKPKYINSPENDVYNKSKSLYGISFAKSSISAKDNCYLVEGYFDVISLHQAGIENVVASSGTSLTEDQIRLIKRYTQNITILYDGDPAGIKASFRGIDMILQQGMNVKVVLFPDGEDPDSYTQKHRSTEVLDLITLNARDFIHFKTDLLLKETGHDPVKRVAVLKEFIESISLIPDNLTRLAYVKEVTQLFEMDERAILNELNKTLRKKTFQKSGLTPEETESLTEIGIIPVEQPVQIDVTSSELQEKDLIRLLLYYGDSEVKVPVTREGEARLEWISTNAAQWIVHDIREDDLNFTNPNYASIFAEYSRTLDQGSVLDDSYFTNHPNKEIANCAIDLLTTPYELHDFEKHSIHIPKEEDQEVLYKAISSSILSFKAKHIEKLLEEYRVQIKDSANDIEISLLMGRYNDLFNLKKELNKLLGKRVITH
jgi:DNA primase